MISKEKQIHRLIDFCNMETTIECTKCGELDGEWAADDIQAAEDFYVKGWRGTENHCYCPKCAKKYLKSEKK